MFVGKAEVTKSVVRVDGSGWDTCRNIHHSGDEETSTVVLGKRKVRWHLLY